MEEGLFGNMRVDLGVDAGGALLREELMVDGRDVVVAGSFLFLFLFLFLRFVK